MSTYKCWVHINGGDYEVTVQAPSDSVAKAMLESQYGTSAVNGWPMLVS